MFLHKLVHCVAAHQRLLDHWPGADFHSLGLSLSVGPFDETCRRLARADSALSRRIARRFDTGAATT